MQEIHLTRTEALVYLVLIPAGIGLLLGLVPLITGIRRGKLKLGILGLVVATIGGGLFGFLLSIPSMAIFTWLILRDKHVAKDALTVDPVSDEPLDEPSSD